MGIFSFFLKFLKENNIDEKVENKEKEESECTINDTVTEIIADKRNFYSNIGEKLGEIRRRKYTQSSMRLNNKLECEILEYLLVREDFNFNVYWNVYVPYSKNEYIKIDYIVITGDTIYIIKCKESSDCINIKENRDIWTCSSSDGKISKSISPILKNEKYIATLKNYLKIDNYKFKSIVGLIVSDDFNGYLESENICLVRNKERSLLFKLLDKKIIKSEKEIDECFVKINNRIYECMNFSAKAENYSKK